MARNQVSLQIDKQTWDAADQQLARAAIEVRGNIIVSAMRKVGNQIKNQTQAILPLPGYPGDKPGLKPLRDTLAVKIKRYEGGSIMVMIVGYTYSRVKGQGGNHGHLLEGGHDIVVGGSKKEGGKVIGHVKPFEYLITVASATKPMQQTTLITAVQKAIKP